METMKYLYGNLRKAYFMAPSQPSIRLTVVVNIITGFLFWFLSIFFAGLNEYKNSGWTIAGMFLPGLIFYILKKDAKVSTAVLLVLNCACLIFPGIEFIKSANKINSASSANVIYLLIFSVGCYFFLRTTYQLFKANRRP